MELIQDMECRFLSVCRRFVNLDIEGIFFDLHPNNLVQHIEHIRFQYQTVNCLDKSIFYDLCCKNMSWGSFDIFCSHNPKSLGNRMKHIFQFIRMELTMDKYKQT